jgi:hypothetical protein
MVKILLSSGAALRGPLALGRTVWARARRKEHAQRALYTGCEQRSFLLKVHFCDSRPNFWAAWLPSLARLSVVPLRGETDMTMLQDHAGELASRSEPNSAAPLLLLAPGEPRPPTDVLSPTKRTALIASLNGGGSLHKRCGAWDVPSASTRDKPISGLTVADLGRDGMLKLCRLTGTASARLKRGSWFARTVVTGWPSGRVRDLPRPAT